MTRTPQDQSPVAGAKLTTLGVAVQAKKSLRKLERDLGIGRHPTRLT
jgi:hypothetical protein